MNKGNELKPVRKFLEATLGIHAEAPLPKYSSTSARKRLLKQELNAPKVYPTSQTTGRIALFLTCYGNHHAIQMVEDMVVILKHNRIDVGMTASERCCGMPKLELGDLNAVAKAKEQNQKQLVELIDNGWDIIAPVPSCVLMFKQELS